MSPLAGFQVTAYGRIWGDRRGYAWRKRLQQSGPVRFALVERSARRQERTTESVLELVLATGERLRIGIGVDITTLRTVLDVLRG